MTPFRLLALIAACVLAWISAPALAEKPTSTVAMPLPALTGIRHPILLSAIEIGRAHV